jgi:formate/nitrite transporter FocA (FNT family)
MPPNSEVRSHNNNRCNSDRGRLPRDPTVRAGRSGNRHPPASLAEVAGALTFGIGLVFLVVGRSELFSENFFDPVATAVDRSGTWLLRPILRLWTVTFVRRDQVAVFASAFTGGALVTLLSYLLVAVDGIGNRITLAYAVGFLLALGPFDHVVVTVLHVVFGILYGTPIGVVALAETGAVITAGNLVGGLGLVTLTHVAQVKGAQKSGR